MLTSVSEDRCKDASEDLQVEDLAKSLEQHHLGSGTQASRECFISLLPEELLTLILNILHWDGDLNDPSARLHIPFLASQVCSYWRFVACQNSVWWSFIYATPPWKFEQIKTFLERANECLLDMTICIKIPNEEEDSPGISIAEFEKLGLILFPHFSRCRTLRLEGVYRTAPTFIPFFMEFLMQLSMPHLESFTSDCDFLFKARDYASRKPLFTCAPKLHDLRLGGMSVATYAPPLSNVTSLHLSRVTDRHAISSSDLFQLLTSCQLLRLLAIYDDFLHNWESTYAFATCNVPHLESLFILGNMLSVSELLLCLDAPKLWELVIAPVIGSDLALLLSQLKEDKEKGIPSRFTRLTKLTLAPAYCDAFKDTLPSASMCFPEVETLIFANVYYPEFITSFTKESPILFPHLANLALSDVPTDYTTINAIKQVVDFRRHHRASLRRVLIDSESTKALAHPLDDAAIWGLVEVKVADLWEEQRKKAMYTDNKDLFVGRPSDE